MKRFTRRDFLKAASIGTASAIAFSCNWIQNPPQSLTEEPAAMATNIPNTDSLPYKAEILVLGAGISGLAAARTLADKGRKVIILEARTRIGGRMWTDTSLGIPLDLGASWIHGVKGNPITQLAKEFNIETIPTDYDNYITFDMNGRRLSDSEEEKMEGLFDSMYAEVEQMQEDEDRDMSLQQAFDAILKSRNLSKEELRRLNFYIQQETSLEYAADPDDLSLWEWDQDEDFSGVDVVFPKGYNQITDALAAGLDIRLNTKVERIKYGKDGVEVQSLSGTFVAEKAIVTFPLGVFKQGTVKFEPPLPKSKQDAIHRLKMGVLNKVYLKFPHVFWDEEIEGFGYLANEISEFGDWLNMMPYINQPVLMAFHGGAKGYEIERISDKEIIDSAMKTLKTMFGDAIPEPIGYVITRWGKDPFSFGSYSHIPPFASGDDLDELSKPVDDVLFFAGEATSRKYPATVHGAYLSGIKAAEKI